MSPYVRRFVFWYLVLGLAGIAGYVKLTSVPIPKFANPRGTL